MNDLYLHAMFGLGGGLGAVLRHWLALKVRHDLPFSTLIVNVLGSLLLGIWIGYLGGPVDIPEDQRRLVFGFAAGLPRFPALPINLLNFGASGLWFWQPAIF